MSYDLGYFDHETGRSKPIENPFGPKPLPPKSATHISGINRNPFVRYGPVFIGAPGKIRTPDPQIRSLVLYPAELPVHSDGCVMKILAV